MPQHPCLLTQRSGFPTMSGGLSSSNSDLRKRSVKRVGPDRRLLEQAFGPHSIFPNAALTHFLGLINGSLFLWLNQMEPLIASDEGKELLKMVSYLPGFPPFVSLESKQSIYTLLVDIETRKCLICGSVKVSLERAVCCIRSHLDHRPFVCGGQPIGCLTCKKKLT
jgi:hypothetical protein